MEKEKIYYLITSVILVILFMMILLSEPSYRTSLFTSTIQWMKDRGSVSHKGWAKYSHLGGGQTDAGVVLILNGVLS
jgi:hypothetical protein